MKNVKSYSELIQLPTFEERLQYLMLYGTVGEETFGGSRYLNQSLYHSYEWQEFRREIIIRDKGCDLGVDGLYISSRAIVHHINPITIEDILNMRPCVFDRDNVILVSSSTHNIIHYAPADIVMQTTFPIRTPNDTKLW